MASLRIDDLSQVYPLARGSSPLIVAGISVTLPGVHLSWIELTAVATIGTGIMSLTLVRRSDGLGNARAALRAILTGGFIAAFSLVDGMGAREAGTALGFYGWLSRPLTMDCTCTHKKRHCADETNRCKHRKG